MSDRNTLPRLDREKYQGFAAMFWSHSLELRATGWLDETFHRDFRELMAHAAAKYHLVCPAYCLMPDHFHLVWLGLAPETDQLNATQFLRKQINRLLAGAELADRTKLSTDLRGVGCEGGVALSSSAGRGMPPTASQPWLRPPVRRSIQLQHQGHDHVLPEEERKRNAFAKTCFYVLENPKRAKLVEHAWNWPFSGALFAGYPSLWPFGEDYWPLFWKLYIKAREGSQP
jgi:putative transposase